MLSKYELKITTGLIKVSLENAADAFSKMAVEEVKVKELEVALMDKSQFLQSLQKLEDCRLVLTTEIKGNLAGKSYLLFNEKDIATVVRIFTKKELTEHQSELSEFQKAIFLELDNIVSAAMVTELANILDVYTYGDVPHFQKLNASGKIELFENDIDRYSVVLNVQSKFSTTHSQMMPSFIWLFKADFIEAIHKLIKSEKHIPFLKGN